MEKQLFLLMFKHKNMRMIGFLEQESIQKKQDVTFLLRNKNVTLKKNGGGFMRYKCEFEEEGVTPEMIEKWGDYDEKEGVMYLTFEVEDITKGVNGSVFLKRRVVRDYSIPLSEL